MESRSYTLCIRQIQTYEIALPLQPKPRRGGAGGGLRQINKHIFKKSRHLGFGVFIDIWSIHSACCMGP